MSHSDYQASLEIGQIKPPFAAMIMAAMHRAAMHRTDTRNLELLKMAFPDIYAEMLARYDAPGGRLPSDKEVG